jgi:hypothetical protein
MQHITSFQVEGCHGGEHEGNMVLYRDRGGTVVKVLRYKSEGRWFDVIGIFH